MAEDHGEQGGEGTVLATMLPVDPFELPQAEPLALTTGKDGQENKPSFILQLLLLDEEGKVRDQKDPLTDASNSQLRPPIRPAKKRLRMDCSNSDQVKSLKRQNYYKDEHLHMECEWAECEATYGESEAFASHVSQHVREAEVRQQGEECLLVCLWAECGFEALSSEEMVRHINFHSFHTKIKCHGLNMLTSHGLQPCVLDPSQRNIVPDLTDPFQCEWAGCELGAQVWERPQHFYSHVCAHGEEVRGTEIRCAWLGCNKTDGSVSKLKEHLRCHSQERLVGCPTCGGLFANRVKFLDHCKRQHVTKTQNYECTNCGKKFALERLLRDHMRSHINHYKCPHCDMTCPTPSSLNNHIRYKHIDEKPFACDLCEYKGKTPGDLKGHIRIHYTEEALKCTEAGCDFTCRAQSTLKSHYLKKHTGSEAQYVCHLCDKRYNRGASLTKHLIGVHNFSWPSGHSRFRYNRDEVTGFYRLQTIRFESADLQEELQGGESLRIADSDAPDSPPPGPELYRTSSPIPQGWVQDPGSFRTSKDPGSYRSLTSEVESVEEQGNYGQPADNYF